jgi:hypothetical protein
MSWQTISAALENKVTTGQLLAILIPLALAGALWLVRHRRQRHPFSMRLSDQPIGVLGDDPPGKRTYRRSRLLSVGDSALTICVTTSVATNVSRFDLRFVERRNARWGDAPPGKIRITDIRVPEWDGEAERERDFVGPNSVEREPNGVGGFIVSTRRPKTWVVGQLLWIEIKVQADAPWSGYLSFEGRTDRRAFARFRVEVIG